MPAKITEQMADYIRSAIRAKKSYEKIGRELGITGHAVAMHAKRKTSIRRCVVCGALIGKGSYCCAPECRKVGDAARKRVHPKDRREYSRAWKLEHPGIKYPRKTRGAVYHRQVELICAVCGRTFLRSQKDQTHRVKKLHFTDSYCSQQCFYNRYKITRVIEQKIANISKLSTLIESEKPIKIEIFVPALEMQQKPESENHMK